MGSRMVSVTPFKSGGSSNEHEGKADKVQVKFKQALSRNIGQPDALAQTLKQPPKPADDTMHFMGPKPSSKGRGYSPAGTYGTPTGNFKSKATGIKPHTDAPGENALGKAMNRVGTNALGNKRK